MFGADSKLKKMKNKLEVLAKDFTLENSSECEGIRIIVDK